MRHLDTDALATFIAVHDLGGFTVAANHLFKTQAAVSLTIRRFEERLGQTLIDRTQRGIVLTKAGETLLTYARRIRKLEDEALRALHNHHVSVPVRVGMPDDYLERFSNQVIRRFGGVSVFPRVEIVCDFSTTLETLLAESALDLAIVTRDEKHTIGDFLFSEPRHWCCANGYFPERQKTIPLALFTEQCRARPLILRDLDAAHVPWHISYTASHLPGVLSAVRLGGALTALPASAVPKDFRVLGADDGLPVLSDIEMALVHARSERADHVGVQEVAAFIHQVAPIVMASA
ncbi:DNA-binding transcriptional LysR family regulator [Robbsia andropogonis]|uniref:LysR family transcriptional regulator n=1 Tax=Robbsia andropogonis TaxID=28092 RepID=UPI003D1E9608